MTFDVHPAAATSIRMLHKMTAASLVVAATAAADDADAVAAGGFEYDGTTEMTPLQASTDAATAANAMLAAGAAAAAVCGVHAPLNPSQELAFGQELQAALQQRAPGEDGLLCSSCMHACVRHWGSECENQVLLRCNASANDAPHAQQPAPHVL